MAFSKACWKSNSEIVHIAECHSSQNGAIHPRNGVDCNIFMLVWRQTDKTFRNLKRWKSLQIHKQIYAKYNGDFDRIYTEGYNSKFYTGRVIEPGKVYELSYLECTCPKVKCGLRNNPQQCECSRQSILYILSQLEPDSHFEVRIENTILRGSDRCTFLIMRLSESRIKLAWIMLSDSIMRVSE
jgi:hypothetical protein